MADAKPHTQPETQFPPDHDLRRRVRDYLLQCASPCKSWFKASAIADSLDARPQEVGKCLEAINQQPAQVVEIVEVRGSKSTARRYHVEIDGGTDGDE